MSSLALFLATVVTASTAWLLAQVPPFLPPFDRGRREGEEPLDETRLGQYQRWFFHMRWIVVLLALLAVIVAIDQGFIPNRMLVPLLLTIAVVALSNFG